MSSSTTDRGEALIPTAIPTDPVRAGSVVEVGQAEGGEGGGVLETTRRILWRRPLRYYLVGM